MKDRMGQSVGSLSVEERVTYYRAAASEALRLAENLRDVKLRGTYLQLAMGWHELATELEGTEPIPQGPQTTMRTNTAN